MYVYYTFSQFIATKQFVKTKLKAFENLSQAKLSHCITSMYMYVNRFEIFHV